MVSRSLTRRAILTTLGRALVGLSILPSRHVTALGANSKFRLAQLQLASAASPHSWNPRPTALRRLGWELDKRTAIDVALDPIVLDPASPRLHRYPLLYLAGDREFSLPLPTGLDALRRYVTLGGMLIIDSAEPLPGGFDASVRRLLAALFPEPGPTLAALPPDHVLHRAFYLLPATPGRLTRQATLEALTYDGRLACVYSGNDLGGAWARDDFGNFAFPCEPGGEAQREQAYRVGINLAMYALTLDYKADQVHVPELLRRRRWRPNDGAKASP